MRTVGYITGVLLVCSVTMAKKSSTDTANGRIHNGNDADMGEYPWVVMFSSGYCTGSLVAAKWVLTTASCALDQVPGRSYALIGDHSILQSGDREDAIFVANGTIVLPNAIIYNNNLGLVKLQQAANLKRPSIRTVPRLSTKRIDRKVQKGEIICYTSSWGDGRSPDGGWRVNNRLQELPSRGISDELCEQFMGHRIDSNICTRPLKKRSGMCNGDEGAPLVCKIHRKWVQVGIWSRYTRQHGCKGGASIYTRVSMFRRFIKGVIGKN